MNSKDSIIIFFLLAVFTATHCNNDNKKSGNKNIEPEINMNPPVSYQPMALGHHTRIIHDEEADTLFIYHRIIASNDTLLKLDFLYSNIEVFNNKDSLLCRDCKSLQRANSVAHIVKIRDFKPDSFRISTWGFGYVIKEDASSLSNFYKLYFCTSIRHETKFPRQ